MLSQFQQFTAPVKMPALTLEAVVALTGLTWVKHIDGEAPPTAQGVYGWFRPDVPHALMYTGKGDGANGLRGRLSDQLAFRSHQQGRLTAYQADPTEDNIWAVAHEVPAIRNYTELRLELWYAETGPATWDVPGEWVTPERAIEWESFIKELGAIVTGNRGLIGGSAWENKSGTLNDRMQKVAWRRLMEYPAEAARAS